MLHSDLHCIASQPCCLFEGIFLVFHNHTCARYTHNVYGSYTKPSNVAYSVGLSTSLFFFFCDQHTLFLMTSQQQKEMYCVITLLFHKHQYFTINNAHINVITEREKKISKLNIQL